MEKMAKVLYSSVVGSLMYAMMCIRHDICYAVGLINRYKWNPGQLHWKVVKKILRYLKSTTDYSLCSQGSDLYLIGYTDAD